MSQMDDRKLDALLDQKYFGATRFINTNQIYLGTGTDACPFYTTNIAHTWNLIEKLREIGYLAHIEQVIEEGFPNNQAYRVSLLAVHLSRICESMNRGLIVGIAPTASQAVCAAAYKAIEINAAAVEQQKKQMEENKNG